MNIKEKFLPILIVIVGIATYLGFIPLFEATKSNVAQHFLPAAFGAIFISIITLFLMKQQSTNEENKERNTKIFEEKLAVFNEFNAIIEQIVRRHHQSGKIESVDVDLLIFRLTSIRMHCKISTVEEITTRIYNIFYDTENDKIKGEIERSLLIDELFKVVTLMNSELFPDASEKVIHENDLGDTFRGQIQSLSRLDVTSNQNEQDVSDQNEIIYYANTGGRSWSDMKEHGFWQGGLTKKIESGVLRLKKGDKIFAYTSGLGYVGVGVIKAPAVKGSEIEKIGISKANLDETTTNQIEKGELTTAQAEEYFVPVEWTEETLINDNPFKKSGLFTSPMTICRLRQKSTIDAVGAYFDHSK